MIIFLQGLNYIIDVYKWNSASAIAANTFARSIIGAIFPLFATYMYDGLGIPWATSLLGFVCVALFPIPILFYIYGERIRAKGTFVPHGPPPGMGPPGGGPPGMGGPPGGGPPGMGGPPGGKPPGAGGPPGMGGPPAGMGGPPSGKPAGAGGPPSGMGGPPPGVGAGAGGPPSGKPSSAYTDSGAGGGPPDGIEMTPMSKPAGGPPAGPPPGIQVTKPSPRAFHRPGSTSPTALPGLPHYPPAAKVIGE